MSEHFGIGGLASKKKVMTQSKSSPALAASFSLRGFSQQHKALPADKSCSMTQLPRVYDESDVCGSNGRWRQRKAQEYFKEKEKEELERLREERAYQEARMKRRQELDARRKRQQQEEEEKRLAKLERERQERIERDHHQKRLEERERLIREGEERDRLARMPITCETCSGTGVCPACQGQGELWATFLVSKVGPGASSTFGRKAQGCEACGGCRQNLTGELQMGSGECADCNGKGKVPPRNVPERSPTFHDTHRSMRHAIFFSNTSFSFGDLSPVSRRSFIQPH